MMISYQELVRTFPKYEQWLKACYERASAYNLQFSSPLDENEVIGVAKSIAKWTNGNFTKESFDDYIIKTHTKDVQSIRGGEKSRWWKAERFYSCQFY